MTRQRTQLAGLVWPASIRLPGDLSSLNGHNDLRRSKSVPFGSEPSLGLLRFNTQTVKIGTALMGPRFGGMVTQTPTWACKQRLV